MVLLLYFQQFYSKSIISNLEFIFCSRLMKSNTKTQVFHRKNTNIHPSKLQTNNLDLQNTSHTNHKRAFNRKPQHKINPFSQVITNHEKPLKLQKNNKINAGLISEELCESNILNPTILLRNSKSVKFIRNGNKCCSNENQKQIQVLQQSRQNFGGQSLIIERRSPQKILDNSYLDQVLSVKSIQRLKKSGIKYITKKKSLQNVLDMSCINSSYLDFIEECQSGNQNKIDSLLKQNQMLKKDNESLNTSVQQLKNQIFKLKKRVNFLQNKSSLSKVNKTEMVQQKNKKLYFEDIKIKNQNLQAQKEYLKCKNLELQRRIETFQISQLNLNSEIKKKQSKLCQLQQNITNLFQILEIKETSELNLHDYLDSCRDKINALSQQLRYKSIQNTILLKIKKDYISISHQTNKFKDQRDYFKKKLSQARKLNQELMKETAKKQIKKQKNAQKQKNSHKSNTHINNLTTESTSETEAQQNVSQKDRVNKNDNLGSKISPNINLKKISLINYKDELFDLSQSEGGQHFQ